MPVDEQKVRKILVVATYLVYTKTNPALKCKTLGSVSRQTFEEVLNVPDDHYPLRRLGAIVGNSRHEISFARRSSMWLAHA